MLWARSTSTTGLLHYPANAWSSNGEKTIKPVNKLYKNFEEAQGMSASDMNELNLHYECEEIPISVIVNYIHEVEMRVKWSQRFTKTEIEDIEKLR